MLVQKSSVSLHDIRLYAFHGVLPLERKVGAWYRVSLDIEYPFRKALESDSVTDTLDYAEILYLVKKEMALPSNLLEHVAGRICKAVFAAFPLTEGISITLRKECPPMGGDTCGASVTLNVTK